MSGVSVVTTVADGAQSSPLTISNGSAADP